MGLRAEDAELLKFAQQHDRDPSNRGKEYSFGRPVNEVFGALHQLAGINLDDDRCATRWTEAPIATVISNGDCSTIRRSPGRPGGKRTDRRWWTTWHTMPSTCPRPRWRPPFRRCATTRSAMPNCKRATRCSPPRTARLRTRGSSTTSIRACGVLPKRFHGHEDSADIRQWAVEEGFDLMGARLPAEGEAPAVHVIRPLGLVECRELGDAWWKKEPQGVTLKELRDQSRPVGEFLCGATPTPARSTPRGQPPTSSSRPKERWAWCTSESTCRTTLRNREGDRGGQRTQSRRVPKRSAVRPVVAGRKGSEGGLSSHASAMDAVSNPVAGTRTSTGVHAKLSGRGF